jgi:uncharacterized protein (DUF488 family)
MLSKKNYIKIADILKANYKYSGCNYLTLNKLVVDLIKYFREDNNNFDEEKFKDYIYGDKK